MRKISALFGFMALWLAMPAAAQTTVAGWTVSGGDGTCVGAKRMGDSLLMIVSPADDASNNGGLIVPATPGFQISEARTMVFFEGSGTPRGAQVAYGQPDLGGFFVPFASTDPTTLFGDTMQMRASTGGQQFADLAVTGFHAAVRAVWSCSGRSLN